MTMTFDGGLSPSADKAVATKYQVAGASSSTTYRVKPGLSRVTEFG